MKVDEFGSAATGAIIWHPGPLNALNFWCYFLSDFCNTWQSLKRTEHPCSRRCAHPSRRRRPWSRSWRSTRSPWRRPSLLPRQRSPAIIILPPFDVATLLSQYHDDDGEPPSNMSVWLFSVKMRNLVSDWEVVVEFFQQFALQKGFVPLSHLVCVPSMVFIFQVLFTYMLCITILFKFKKCHALMSKPAPTTIIPNRALMLQF